MQMDRIIHKTQALIVGAGPEAAAAAAAARKTGAQTAILDSAVVRDAPEDVTAVNGVVLDKIILYPEGRVAGVMGHQRSDGMKVIVNTDAVLLTPAAADTYRELCRQFGAAVTDGGIRQTDQGQMVDTSGKEIGGMYVIGDPAATGQAGGAYAVMIDETIYARFRKNPMVEKEPTIPGEYLLTIIGIPGIPKHKVVITEQDGVLTGTHTTENDSQPMLDLHMEDGYLCWNLWAGTTSSELFTYHVKAYGDTWLGGTWRIDTENAQHTPVMMENAHPRNPFGPPPESKD